MDLLRISLVQFDVVWENPLENLMRLDSLLDPLKGNTDLILLPEMFTTGFSMNSRLLAEEMTGESVKWMKNKALQIGAAVAGSLIIKEKEKFFNRFVFVTPADEIHFYDKKHLFSIGSENLYFHAGDKRMIVNYEGWRIALYVCYDLRFPVWCRSIKDADLILFAANWPKARAAVWTTLLSARALENQLYVAAVNRTGVDGLNISYSGDSRLINPRGSILCDLSDRSNSVETVSVSLSEIHHFREKFPVGKDDDRFEILS